MCSAVTVLGAKYDFAKYNAADVVQYHEVSQILDRYDYDEVFICPAATYYMLDRDEYIFDGLYDDGHIEYFYNSKHPEFVDKWFHYTEVSEACGRYKALIDGKIENKEFEIIVGNSVLIDQDILNANYTITGTKTLKQDCGQTLKVAIWARKNIS